MRLPSMVHLLQLLLTVVVSTVLASDNNEESYEVVELFLDCNIDDFYASLPPDRSSWTKEQVFGLLEFKHRNTVASRARSANEADLNTALIDLWPGNYEGQEQMTVNKNQEQIRLIYRDISIDASPADQPETWEREHLWPVSRGINRDSKAMTDVHVKAPADWTVLMAKGDLFFGECGTVEAESECVSPANDETPPDTSQDGKIWKPPLENRGKIARALFYNQLLYETELGLQLSDCPPFGEADFGYLSPLLEWNTLYPPTQDEIERNDRACGYWQGNRNVFVDFPDLVQQFWGLPDEVPPGARTYTKCMVVTPNPTATLNECSYIDPGDLFPRILSSEDPDQFVIFPLANIDQAVGSIYITDKAWDGAQLGDSEGTCEYKLGPNGIQAGEEFGFNIDLGDDEGEWVIDDQFNLNIEGDNMFIYCINADGLPHFIAGITYAGSWQEAGADNYRFNETALPESLNGTASLVLPLNRSHFYDGPDDASGKPELLDAYTNPENWNESQYRLIIGGEEPTPSPNSGTSMTDERFVFARALTITTSILGLFFL